MEGSRKEDEERALALAALALAKATIDTLEAKGLMDAGDVQIVFDRALTSLELRRRTGPPASPAASWRGPPPPAR